MFVRPLSRVNHLISKIFLFEYRDRKSEALDCKNRRLATSIAEMALSVRIVNALEKHNVILAEQLMSQTYDSLIALKNFGSKRWRKYEKQSSNWGSHRQTGKEHPRRRKPRKRKTIKAISRCSSFGEFQIHFWSRMICLYIVRDSLSTEEQSILAVKGFVAGELVWCHGIRYGTLVR